MTNLRILSALYTLFAPPTGPDAASVYIEKITTGGDGCPSPAAVATTISEDRTLFVLSYIKMLIEHPPGPAVEKVHCKAGVHLHVPRGWQVALTHVTTRGYAYLEHDVVAHQTASYRLAGVPIGAEYSHALMGPHDDFYQFTDEPAATVWSKCGGPGLFAFTTTLTLDTSANPEGQAIFNTTSSDGEFAKVVHLDWRPC
jgi:hypothetical protein